jgi:hypothetical protein
MKTRDILTVFNRGRISRLALARSDVARIALSAEVQTNWLPRILGSMMLRPGLEKRGPGATVGGDGSYIPFIFARDDTAIIEMSPFGMRIWDDGDVRVTRPAVSATITNGDFATDLTGWTDADDGASVSSWAAGGFMELLGTGLAAAKRRQSIAITETNTIHGLRITVERGPLLFRVGTAAGLDDIFNQAVLRTGTHSLAIDPGGNGTIWIEFSSTLSYPVLVSGVSMESGVVTLPTPWPTASDNKTLRWSQSGDVIFIASNVQQRRIERREDNSWSIVTYEANDGPFLTENTGTTTLTASALSGAITITASQPAFSSDNVGSLFRMTSLGQRVEASLSAEDTYTNYIRVTGVGAQRAFTVSLAGTWVGTASLQRSIGEPGAWVAVTTYTANGDVSYNDGFDNSVIYYRLGFEAGDYTSGTADTYLEFSSGSITGVARVTGYTSETQVSAIVLQDFGGTEATSIWAEGEWSDRRGWPTAAALTEGRLWWFGNGRAYGSVSDAYTSFDPDYEGDAGPINRAVSNVSGYDIAWAMALDRLMVGTGSAVRVVRSSSLDEPITPTNYNVKNQSNKGAWPTMPASSGKVGYFVGGDGVSLYEMRPDGSGIDYGTEKVNILIPEITAAGIVKIAVQEEPDVRIHCVLADGTVAIIVRDDVENVKCWIDVTTDGFIEDVAVLPGDVESRVFYRVKRVIGGVDVRYHEELSRMDQCIGGQLSQIADSHVVGSGVISGLGHLEGENVVVWADGADRGTHAVSSGALPTLTSAFTTWCAGLGYQARYKSAKLVSQTNLGLSLTQRSRINKIGLILADTHAQGLEFGPSFDVLDGLPMVENGADVDQDAVRESYDEDMVEFPGDWDTDNRVCLVANAPRPCTVLAAVMNVDRHDND